jgi:hypothetical protein
MSGSTSCGLGPSCESDVMGRNPHPALQKDIEGISPEAGRALFSDTWWR